MSKDRYDFSGEDLLNQLSQTTELDVVMPTQEIELPEMDFEAASELSPEESFARGRGYTKEDSNDEDVEELSVKAEEATEAPEAQERYNLVHTPVSEEDDIVFVAPVTESDVLEDSEIYISAEPAEEEEKVVTKEFSKVTETKAEDTAVFATVDDEEEEGGEVDVDALMKKYLSEAEYEEVMQNRAAVAEVAVEPAQIMTEAEEYVSSIESEIEKAQPHEPVTETEKAVQELDLADVADEGFDETDVNLMIAFDMEDELKEKLGQDQASIISEAVDKDAEIFGSMKREDNIPDEISKDMEFVAATQIKDVFEIYKKKYRNVLVKVFGSLAMVLIIALFENLGRMGAKIPDILDSTLFPVVSSMLSLELLLAACVFVITPICRGFKALFTGKPTSDSILSVTVALSVAYHIAVCFLYNGKAIVFCNLPVALYIFFTVVSSWISLKRDIFSFNIVSSKRTKHILAKVPEENASAEHRVFEEYIYEDAPVFKVAKTNFVDNFFEKTRRYPKNNGLLGAMIAISIVLCAFLAVFYGVKYPTDGVIEALKYAYVGLMLTMPLSAVLSYSLPLYRASKAAFEMGSAILGEAAPEDYEEAEVISFDDKDVFLSNKTKVKSIKVYGNNRIDRIIYNVASLFKALGGPLCDVFSIATKEFDCSDDVEIMDIAEDGIEAVISGKHIFYGKASYLIRNNFDPVVEAEDQRLEFRGEASISYLVCNDEVAAKIYISYGFDPDFTAIAKQLSRAGICIGIKSFDPNIDDELLAKHLNLEKYAVKIIKCCYLSEKTEVTEHADSTIVSKKSPKSLLRTLVLCEKVSSASRFSVVVKALSVLIGFVIMILAVLQRNLFEAAGIYTALYQLFWLVPVALLSVINIRK